MPYFEIQKPKIRTVLPVMSRKKDRQWNKKSIPVKINKFIFFYSIGWVFTHYMCFRPYFPFVQSWNGTFCSTFQVCLLLWSPDKTRKRPKQVKHLQCIQYVDYYFWKHLTLVVFFLLLQPLSAEILSSFLCAPETNVEKHFCVNTPRYSVFSLLFPGKKK